MLTLPDVTITLCRSGLVPGSAKIVHPVFVTPVAVQIVRDGCVARPGLRRSGCGHWLCRIQVQIRHRHCVCKFALIHGPPFSIPEKWVGSSPLQHSVSRPHRVVRAITRFCGRNPSSKYEKLNSASFPDRRGSDDLTPFKIWPIVLLSGVRPWPSRLPSCFHCIPD